MQAVKILRPCRSSSNTAAWLRLQEGWLLCSRWAVPDGLDEAAAGTLDAQHRLKGWHDLLAGGMLAADALPQGSRLPHHTLPHFHTQHQVLRTKPCFQEVLLLRH